MKRKKKAKRIKLESTARIRRRLNKKWALIVRWMHDNKCAVTGLQSGAKLPNGKKVVLDCHHLESRIICRALRWDPMNGILLSKQAHKYGRNSAHQGPIWFITWLHSHRRLQYDHVLNHRDDPAPDINSREVLYEIESRLGSENNWSKHSEMSK